MKSLKDIIAKHPCIYMWDDNTTLDYIFNNDDDEQFIKQLYKFKCVLCQTPIINNNEYLIHGITDNVKGMHLTCKHCNQKYFLHQYVQFK